MIKAINNIQFSALLLIICFISDYLFLWQNPGYRFSIMHQTTPNLLSYIIFISFIPHHLIRRIFLYSLVFASGIQYLHFQYFGVLVQPISFYHFYFNTGEVFESFFYNFSQMILPILIIIFYFLSIYYLDARWNYKKLFQLKSIYIILLFALLFQGHRTHNLIHNESGKIGINQALRLYPRLTHHSADNFQRSLKYFFCGILPDKVLGDNIFFPSLEKPELINEVDCNIILIIGESLRAKQLQVLGYNKNTTPNLSRMNELFSKTIYAGGTMTQTSLPVILNRVKYPGATSQIYSEKNALFKLAKDNGFTTYFFSAQKQSQLSILENYIGKSYIDLYFNRSNSTENTYFPNDEILLAFLKKIDFNRKNFILLQQRGSHLPYVKQYPKSFDIFELDYDNSVLYTDHILKEIFAYIKK